MDAESAGQIERISTAPVGSSRGRSQKDTGLAASLNQELGAKTEELNCHQDALHAELSRKIDSLVKGSQSLGQKIDNLGRKMEDQFRELRALFKLS